MSANDTPQLRVRMIDGTDPTPAYLDQLYLKIAEICGIEQQIPIDELDQPLRKQEQAS